MLGNCEKMVLIPSARNEWSQNNQIDDQKVHNNNNNNNNMALAAQGRVMGDQKVISPNIVASQDHHQQQQQQIKHQNITQEPQRCPRCDSTNTKFCYYNNYSLSQPRHFCKACKRYWTRGGTLRNVPVGGACRKNKRVRRPGTSSSSSSMNNNSSATSLDASCNNSANSASSIGGSGGGVHDMLSSSTNQVNPFLYGLPGGNLNQGSEIHFPFARYDLQNQLGLGFSPSGMGSFSNVLNNGSSIHPNGSKQIFQDLIASNPFLSSYNNLNSSSSSTSSTISSLLASTLQMKGGGGGHGTNFHTLLPSYNGNNNNEHDIHMKGSNGGMFAKDVKLEMEGQNRRMDHHQWSAPSQNHHMDQTTNIGSSNSDQNGLWVGGSNLGTWLDPSNNLGSSVPSLI